MTYFSDAVVTHIVNTNNNSSSSQRTTDYGNYTNYGQHAQGFGIINNYGPQTMNHSNPMTVRKSDRILNRPTYNIPTNSGGGGGDGDDEGHQQDSHDGPSQTEIPIPTDPIDDSLDEDLKGLPPNLQRYVRSLVQGGNVSSLQVRKVMAGQNRFGHRPES